MQANRTLCFTCHKPKLTYNCRGCAKDFCLVHLRDHRQLLNRQLDGLTNERDALRQHLVEQRQNSRNSPFIERIDQWERKAIEKIKRRAQHCRETAVEHSVRTTEEIEHRLNRLTSKLRQMRQYETEFNEMDLRRLTDELAKMKLEVCQPRSLSLQEDSRALINDVRVKFDTTPTKQRSNERRGDQQVTTVAGGNEPGRQLSRLSLPFGIYVDGKQNILIADQENSRVVRWEPQANRGILVAGGNRHGKRLEQLDCPTDVLVDERDRSIIIADSGNRRVIKWSDGNTSAPRVLLDDIKCFGLAMDKEGFLYVSNSDRDEVIRWKEGETEGTVVAGGNERGDGLDQLNQPRFIFVDDERSVFVSDWKNHRVMKWKRDADEGVVVSGGHGQGAALNQLSFPNGLFVDSQKHVYVADSWNRRMVRWREGQSEGEVVVGGHERGQGSSQLSRPMGLSFDDEGNLYVADFEKNRVVKFDSIRSST